jgi:putative membrane protein
MSPGETASPGEAAPKDRGTILAEERTDLAMTRTIIASERTLMAWIRTSISMIGFGFTMYKFFQYLPADIAAGTIKRPNAPRNLGLTLIALGTLALAAAAWQHRSFLNQIGASKGKHQWSLSFTIALFVILIGVIAFFGVLLKEGPF